jgi:ethanolamine transporter EutH
MSGWQGYVVLVLVILVAIAPRQVLGPLFGLAGRYVGAGAVALVALGAGSYTLGVAASEREHWLGYGALGLGVLCGAWWIYRLAVPAYRDQAPDSAPLGDDR